MKNERDTLILKGSRQYGLLPIRNGTDLEWAWAAGIYEGEGSAHANGRNKARHDIQVRIVQKDTHILHQLRQFCGGNIGLSWCKRASELVISGSNARRFMRHTWKWYSPRRQDQITKICPIEEC